MVAVTQERVSGRKQPVERDMADRPDYVTAAEAVAVIESGQRVGLGWGPNEPGRLINALAARAPELRNVQIADVLGGATVQPLLNAPESFRAWTTYVGAPLRPAIVERRADFTPASYGLLHQHGIDGRAASRGFDVYMVKVSPPDEMGFCSFGRALWLHKFSAQRSSVVIGEVDHSFIKTYGDNFIHISGFDFMVDEATGPQAPSMFNGTGRQLNDRESAIDSIGGYFADLIRDGDTLQFGAGTVSGMMPPFLLTKHDLGVHTEACPQAVLDLVRAGVVNGRRKTIHTGKVVASVFGVVDEDLPLITNNPMWELYDINYVDNPLVIAQHENFVAVNTCLEIDLSGQVNAESLGSDVYSGAGGQPDFVMGALLSKGGRAIHVMQSTAKHDTVSTIVPTLAAGSGISVTRNYIDFVVTEFGAVNLQGKSLRERANELISIAHPDFRGELRQAAAKLFGSI